MIILTNLLHQMLLFLLESISEVFSKTPENGLKKMSWQNNKEIEIISDEIIPDGDIATLSFYFVSHEC